MLLEKNMHSPLLGFPCRGTWVWLALPASLPYLSPHSASGDEWLSNQWVSRGNWSQCLLLSLLESNLPAKGMMLVLFLSWSQGLPSGAAWRCCGPLVTKDISLSNSSGMSKQEPLPTILEPHFPTGLIKLTLELYLSVSWFLIFNLCWIERLNTG